MLASLRRARLNMREALKRDGFVRTGDFSRPSAASGEANNLVHRRL